MKLQLISIETKRYSEFFRRLFEEYAANSHVIIDGKTFDGSDFTKLKEDWGANEQIKRTRDFKLIRGRVELFGFHDSPNELWAAMSEVSFVKRMAEEKIVRYKLPN